MLLTMRKGQEHRLVITPRLDDQKEFMYFAYRQALDALREIVQQSKAFLPDCEEDIASKLYGYAHNIIVFSGSRGQGKTSSMLSFSGAMKAERSGSRDGPLGMPAGCDFTVLPPIDPTILEEDQTILAVILSRMYRQAEDAWQKNSCGRSEADKNDLLELFQQCLSGINAIKFRKGKEIQTLHAIHEISDSSLLKENFYKLTRKLLCFLNGKNQTPTPFLVIQLDDTDFQIRKGYEILEDIRKYLTLPNVIILMATDLDMLRHALTQHYIKEFQQGLDNEILGINDLRKLESKYLDKLIPPTFTVYLPHLDDVIRQQGDFLHLTYIDPEEEKTALRERREPVNLLLRPSCPCQTEDFSFQSLLLRYIYRKTRIVFAEHSTYMHDLIPTTLRGLSQFLGLLTAMADVPDISPDDPKLDDPHALAELVQSQAEVLEANLPLFENYFVNDWVHTKLPMEKAAVIERLAGALPEQRCPMAITLLEGIYGKREGTAPGQSGDAGDTEAPPATAENDYAEMIRRLREWEAEHRRMEDFYLFFAVHTFFTIQAHRSIVRQKRRAIAAFKEAEARIREAREPSPVPLLLFDLSPESTGLPAQFQIPGLPDQVGGYKMSEDVTEADYEAFCAKADNDYACQLLVPRSGDGSRHFSVMNLIGLFLALGSPEGRKLAVGDLSQKELFLVQTSAAAIAANWDVQNRLYKLPREGFETSVLKEGESRYSYALRHIWEVVDRSIRSIDPCMRSNDPCPMVSSQLRNMVKFIVGEDNYGDSRSALQRILRAAEMRFGENTLGAICDIYDYARKLRECMRMSTAFESDIKVQTARNTLSEVFRGIRIPAIKEQFDITLLNNRLNDCFKADTKKTRATAKGAFTRAINTQMKNLCEKFGYTTDEIEALLAGRKEQ